MGRKVTDAKISRWVEKLLIFNRFWSPQHTSKLAKW